MSIESIIGVSYCVVAMIFLAATTVKAARDGDYRESDRLFVVMAWPLLVVLWLIDKKKYGL